MSEVYEPLFYQSLEASSQEEGELAIPLDIPEEFEYDVENTHEAPSHFEEENEEVTFHEPTYQISLSIGENPVLIELPDLVLEEATRKGKRQHQLTALGHTQAARLFEQIYSIAGLESDEETQKNLFGEAFRQLHEQISTPEHKQALDLFKRSCVKRLDIRQSIALQSRIEAENAPSRGLAEHMRSFYPTLHPALFENMLLSMYGRIRRSFAKEVKAANEGSLDVNLTHTLEAAFFTQLNDGLADLAPERLIEGNESRIERMICQVFSPDAETMSLLEVIAAFVRNHHEVATDSITETMPVITEETLQKPHTMETAKAHGGLVARLGAIVDSAGKVLSRNLPRLRTREVVAQTSAAAILFNSVATPTAAYENSHHYNAVNTLTHPAEQMFLNGVNDILAKNFLNPSIEMGSLVADPFLQPGNVLSSRDMLIIVDRLTNELHKQIEEGQEVEAIKTQDTLRFVASFKRFPQAVNFRLEEQHGHLTITPVDWQENIEVREIHHSDLTVVGNGPEMVAAAIAAADLGKSVTLMYEEGALGGDLRHNRYADFNGQETEAQHKMRVNGLKMEGHTAVPAHAHENLFHYLSTSYAHAIHLVEIPTFKALHVDKNHGAPSVITADGRRFEQANLLDGTSGELAEKIGMSIEPAPNQAFGIPVSVAGEGVNKQSMVRANMRLGSKEGILEALKINDQWLSEHPTIARAVEEILNQHEVVANPDPSVLYGLSRFAKTYHLRMEVAAIQAHERGHKKEAAELDSLNQIRDVQGFNIALSPNSTGDGQEMVLNGFNYKWGNDSRLSVQTGAKLAEPRFAVLKTETAAINEYFQDTVSKDAVATPAPELYVRQDVHIINPFAELQKSDFDTEGVDPQWQLSARIDQRGLAPRSGHDKNYFYLANTDTDTVRHWAAASHTACTPIDHYFIVNKENTGRNTFGLQRLQQPLITTAVKTVHDLYTGQIIEERVKTGFTLQHNQPSDSIKESEVDADSDNVFPSEDDLLADRPRFLAILADRDRIRIQPRPRAHE